MPLSGLWMCSQRPDILREIIEMGKYDAITKYIPVIKAMKADE